MDWVWKISYGVEKNKCPTSSKNDKQLIENYRAIWLLSVCGKILERLIYNKMFEFFTENELIFHNQSFLKPGDSCIYQLLSITVFISHSMMVSGQAASFLIYQKHLIKFDMRFFSTSWSRTVDQVAFKMLSSIFSVRENKVVLNGQLSTLTNVDEAGAP